jgi:hypothetical protein
MTPNTKNPPNKMKKDSQKKEDLQDRPATKRRKRRAKINH